MTTVKLLRIPLEWEDTSWVEDEEDQIELDKFNKIKVGDILDVSTKGKGHVRLYSPDCYIGHEDIEWISGDPLKV